MKNDLVNLKYKISSCSTLISDIERIEFVLIDHGMIETRKLTRLVKRHLIFKQTEYWTALDGPKKLVIPKGAFKKTVSKKKKRK